MKYLTFALIVLHIQAAMADSLVTSNYKGEAKGSIQLQTETGTSLLSDGRVDISVKRVNPLSKPLDFFRGARTLTIKAQDKSFVFEIPYSLDLLNGRGLVSNVDSLQPADMGIRETRVHLGTKDETHIDSCTYYGFCYDCVEKYDGSKNCEFKMSQNCKGTEEVLYRVDSYERSLDLLINSDTQTVKIKTEGTPEFSNTRLKTIRSCR